jgi:hypothetical protein
VKSQRKEENKDNDIILDKGNGVRKRDGVFQFVFRQFRNYYADTFE